MFEAIRVLVSFLNGLTVFERWGRYLWLVFKPLAAVFVLMILGETVVFAGQASTTLSVVTSTINGTVGYAAMVLSDVSLIAGIGFVMASMFKLYQHKLNPTQVPMSQGISLLLIGGGLTMFPELLSLPGTTWLGSTSQVAQVGGQGVATIIGATTG